jgi:hypothetical protein
LRRDGGAPRRIIQHAQHGSRHDSGVAGRNEYAGDAVLDHFGDGAERAPICASSPSAAIVFCVWSTTHSTRAGRRPSRSAAAIRSAEHKRRDAARITQRVDHDRRAAPALFLRE